MKKVKLAVAILICILALVIASQLYTKHVTNSMIDELTSAYTYANQNKKGDARQAIARLDGQWEGAKTVFATFVRHAELDSANLSIAKLRPLLENDEKGDFDAECKTLEFQLHHIWETERFSLDNIL